VLDNPWFLLLEATGATVVFTQASIFAGLRSRGPALWRTFAACPLCVGQWVGMAIRAWFLVRILGLAGHMECAAWAIEIVGFGAATGMLALLVRRLVFFLEALELREDAERESRG
jgi:hypothetical protein